MDHFRYFSHFTYNSQTLSHTLIIIFITLVILRTDYFALGTLRLRLISPYTYRHNGRTLIYSHFTYLTY